MTSQKSKQVRWKIEFVSFKCRHCSAPFQLPQELVNHKKKYHAKEIQRYPAVRRQRERFSRNRSTAEIQNSPSPRRNVAYSRVIQGSSGATPSSIQVKQEPRWFYGNNDHRCAECNIEFMTEKSLKDHRERHHNPARAFPCSWCDSSFADAGPRQNHVMLHENRLRDGTDFPCGLCDKRYLSAFSAENHRRNDHQATSPLQHREQITEQHDVPTQQSINRLIKKKKIKLANGTVTRFSCAECNKNFRERSVAIDHAYIHMENRPHQCDSCEAEFSNQAALATHLQECHVGQGPSVKIKKEKMSPHKASTRMASRRKSGKQPNYVENSEASDDDSEHSVPSLSGPFARALLPPNKIKAEEVSPGAQNKQAKKLPNRGEVHFQNEICELCGETLDSRTMLFHYRQHAKLQSLGSDFPCEQCTFRFLKFSQLELHVAKQHNTDIDDARADDLQNGLLNSNDSNEDVSEEQHLMLIRPAECRECGIEFETSYDLIDHKKDPACKDRWKSYIRISACHICDFISIRPTDLVVHIQLHSSHQEENTDFPCTSCPKRYLTKLHLHRHVQTCHGAASSSLEHDVGGGECLSNPENEDNGSIGNRSLECSLTSAESDAEESFSDEERSVPEVHPHSRHSIKPINLKGVNTEAVSTTNDGHDVIGFFFCDICDYKCIWKEAFEEHQTEHEMAKIHEEDFPCPYCPKRFLEPSEIQDHAKKCTVATTQAHITNPPRTSTGATGKNLAVKRKLRQIVRSRCRTCNTTFSTMLQLYEHKISKCLPTRKHKSELEYFKCQSCDYTCIWKGQRRKHACEHLESKSAEVLQPLETPETVLQDDSCLVNEDREEIPNKCNSCPAVFLSPKDLFQHKVSRKCHEDLDEFRKLCYFECQECGYTCIWKSQQDQHRLLHPVSSQNEPESPCPESSTQVSAEQEVVDLEKNQSQQQSSKTSTPGGSVARKEGSENSLANATESNLDIAVNKYILPPAFKANTMRYQQPETSSLYRRASAELSNGFDEDINEPTSPTTSVCPLESADPIDISRLDGSHNVPNVHHTCHTCQTEFLNVVQLVKHRRAVHPSNIDYDYGVFPCTYCDDLIQWKVAWRNHVETHRQLKTTNRDYPCSACPKRFVLLENRNVHMSGYHSDIGQLETSSLCSPKPIGNFEVHENHPVPTQATSSRRDEVSKSRSPKNRIHVVRGYKIPFRKMGSVRGTGIATKSPKVSKTPVKVVRGYKISLRQLGRGKLKPSLKSVNSAKKHLLNKSRLAITQTSDNSTAEASEEMIANSSSKSPVPAEICMHCGFSTLDADFMIQHLATHSYKIQEKFDFPCDKCPSRFSEETEHSKHQEQFHSGNGILSDRKPSLDLPPNENPGENNSNYLKSNKLQLQVGNKVQKSEAVLSTKAKDIENPAAGVDTQLPAEDMSYESQSISTDSYACSCGKHFDDFDALKLHVEHDHSDGSSDLGLRKAAVEEDHQSDQQIIVTDIRTEEETTYNLACADCGESFTDELSLETHLKLHQTSKDDSSDYPCPLCHLRFQEKMSLELHTVQYHPKSNVIDNNQFFQACASLSNERINGQVPVIKHDQSAQTAHQHKSSRKTRSMKRDENGESEEFVCAKCKKSFSTLPDYFTHRQSCYDLSNTDDSSCLETHEEPLEDRDVKMPLQKFSNGQTEAIGRKRSVDVVFFQEEDLYTRVKNRRRASSANPRESSSSESLASNQDRRCTLKK